MLIPPQHSVTPATPNPYNGVFSLATSGTQFGGIAWWAHVGGFAFGLVVCLFARGSRRTPPPIIEI
jgi:membrane associated rhomboid family serine protease